MRRSYALKPAANRRAASRSAAVAEKPASSALPQPAPMPRRMRSKCSCSASSSAARRSASAFLSS
ncbi:hypothetical protein AMQ83_10605 [Paenibacillus riograndensis]|nr:hypothetical protein AMQ83_10605 [Paenibacillus riograndensis]